MNRQKESRKGPSAEDGLVALQRAVRKARELAEQTGTPFYVLRDGEIVDLVAEKRTLPEKRDPAKG
jgi:hypothetical protein